MRRGILCGIAAILGVLMTTMMMVAAHADVTITTVTYNGWQNCYRLTNGTVDVVVVPAVARIMRYGFVGGPNALWENQKLMGKPPKPTGSDWANIGGDKIWPWPQDDWAKHNVVAWPPPPGADQMAHTASIAGPATVRLVSPIIVGYGVQIVRDITLAPTGTAVTIVSRLEKIRDSAMFPMSPWSIFQIPAPERIFARRLPGSTLPNGNKPNEPAKWKRLQATKEMVVIERAADHAEKLFVDGDLLAAMNGDTLVSIRNRTASDPANSGKYMAGDQIQVYTNPDAVNPDNGVTGYVELECTAPLQVLAKGQSATMETVWQLQHLTPEQRGNEAAIIALLMARP